MVEVVEHTQSAVQDLARLREEVSAASAAQFNNEPIRPVGTVAWEALIRKAVRFSREHYQQDSFPASVSDSRCVLCQQPLEAEAADRLTRFWAYLNSTVAADMKAKEAELQDAVSTLTALDLQFLPEESGLRRSLESIDQTCLSAVDAFLASLETRRDALVNLEPGDPPPSIGLSPLVGLDATLARLDERINELATLDPKEKIEELRKELCLLTHRRYLSQVLPAVLNAVSDLRWVATASFARAEIQTGRLTRKRSAIVKKLLAANYQRRFHGECSALGFALPVKVKFSGDVGETKKTLAFGNGKAAPSRVLSEGEQRAAALADFLVEASLRGSVDGIILDDPVNSLDHDRKEMIAKRLVYESLQRQVIVFTHDIVFVHYLAEEAVRKGGQFKADTVWRMHLHGCLRRGSPGPGKLSTLSRSPLLCSGIGQLCDVHDAGTAQEACHSSAALQGALVHELRRLRASAHVVWDTSQASRAQERSLGQA